VTAFLEGCTPEEMGRGSIHLYNYRMSARDWLLPGTRRDEAHAYLAERQRQSEKNRQEVEQHFNPIGIRERLLARRIQNV
jgi:hypothetical protein